MFDKKTIVFSVFFLVFLNATNAQVGIGTINPKSTLDINGNLSVKTITLIGGSSTTNINDGVYISINPQAADQEFRLPSPIIFPGRMYFIRNISNGNTAKLTAAAGLIFTKGSTAGGANEIYMYENNRRSIWLLSDGSNWTYFD